MYNLLIRVDGGDEYGTAMGHAYRTVRIAKFICRQGVNVIFFMRNFAAGFELVDKQGFEIVLLPIDIDDREEALLVTGKASEIGAVIYIDLPNPKHDLIKLARKKNITTVVYEDKYSDSEPDRLISISPFVDEYKKRDYCNTQLFLGNRYVVLDASIQKYKKNDFFPEIKKLFVNFGGADPCNFSKRVLEILISRDDAFEICLVLGPAYKYSKEIEETLTERDLNHRVSLFIDVDCMSEVQTVCDAALSAGGTTVYELIALGIPTLVLPSIKHEKVIGMYLHTNGLVDCIPEDVNRVDDDIVYYHIDGFINDNKKRKSIFSNMTNASLHHGLRNVSDVIMSCV